MSVYGHRISLRAQTGRSGVTLIELMTAAAAMTVVAGMTLAALGGARSTNQLEICLNNLRVIGAASAQYSADDPGEIALPMHHKTFAAGQTRVIGYYQYGGKSGRVDQPVDFIYSIEGGYRSLSRPLNYYLYDIASFTPPECVDLGLNPPIPCREADKSLPLYKFRCPTDTGFTGLHYGRWNQSDRSGFDYFGTSYQANLSMVCTDYPKMSSNSPFQRPRSQVPNPARTVQYMETCGRFAWAWGYSPWPYGTDFTVGGWHGEDWKFTMVFMDGSARYTEMKGTSTFVDIVDGPEDVEYVPGLPGGINNWWQVIFRGDDWQLDTLPAPPAWTGKCCSSLGDDGC